MDMIPDDETGGFCVTWTIENLSYCLQKKGEHLFSPFFKSDLSDDAEWQLGISPRGYENDDRIEILLLKHAYDEIAYRVKTYFSIRTINGIFKRIKNECPSSTFGNYGLVNTCLFTRDELFKEGDDAILENDTLTVRCRIWKKHPGISVPGKCSVRTLINVQRIAFTWTLENFIREFHRNEQQTIKFYTASRQSFTMSVLLSSQVFDNRNIQVKIEDNGALKKKSFLTCKLSLLNADGKTTQSVLEECWFNYTKFGLNWAFPFVSLKEIMDNEKLYLVNGALSLHCEFAVSFGEEYNKVERTEYGVTKELDKICYSKTVDSNYPGSLRDNLHCFYNECKFSDVTVQTATSKKFPVHKAVLCARSKVFSAMFEHDTKENRTGVIEIEDLSDDTVSKMLLFAYTDIAGDLDWESASELYFAAEKYGIGGLKRQCSTFLKGNMDSSNVCELLVLADMHHDQDMKSAAQDFVLIHAVEIINSENWKKFVKEKANLAAETLQILFMKNLNM